MARSNSSPAARASFLGLVAATLALVLAAAAPALANPILLVEADTGKVLEQKEAGRPWHPASVTKLMTVYVALNAVKNGRLTMDTPITVSPAAAAQQPSKMGFRAGTVVTLDNALKMVLVKSANDMAWVVGEGVGGSMPEFVAEMNATAAHLGMSGTHFENPNGLPDEQQITTARDLAILARAIIYHFPEQEALFRIPAIKLGKAVIRNYNRLIDRYPGADGMKTGFVCGSGYNLVATATRGNKRLIAVILGARSGTARTEQAALLFEKGFQATWSPFGAVNPLLSSISNQGGPPGNMKAEVCGGKRAVTASEADDEPDPTASAGFAFAAPTLPKSGAELLQTLPPSMAPVPVYVGTRNSVEDFATAYAPDEKPKKPKQAAKPDAKPDARSKATASADGDGAADGDKDPPKAAAKPAAKPAPKPATATASTSDKPKTDAPKKQVQPQAPVAAGSVPTPKPKPKPKPAETPAESAAPAPKPAT